MNMAAQKHLHELLREVQEPFLLNNYIADKRCQLKSASTKSQQHLQVKKRRPISQVSNFPGNLCKNACFFSLQDSPDLRKSPLFDFSSPAAKSPCKSPNAIFLHIPNRTAALLVEAAMRIQKQSVNSKPKTQSKNHGFGLLGSLFKRLTNRNRTRKREINGGDGVQVSVKDILQWDSSVGRRKISSDQLEETVESCLEVEDKSASLISIGRPSSAVWSETNEATSSSCSQSEEESADTDCPCNCDKINAFCESPFRFVLQPTPSPSGHCTPEFTSPAASPSRHKQEEEGLQKFQAEVEEEEEKEQCSPVSVLDPPFQEDDEGHDDEDGFDLECSYANVQRTKHHLLLKRRRFEQLAGLDPIELEKRMLEEEDGNDDECENDESETSDSSREETLEGLLREVLSKLNFPCNKSIPEEMQILFMDLIVEEQREVDDAFDSREDVVGRA